MGVKGLWSFLSPVCEKKSLWELQGQTVAVDLSCWICDSQTISFTVIRPHLRNLFFRTSCLLLSDIRPLFVLEGEAPDIKQQEIRRRNKAVWNGDTSNLRRKENRPRLSRLIKQCCVLLESLGLNTVPSPGEAEAMCARLNSAGVVDGCITQDNDCFLYGANVVYRNFSSTTKTKKGGSSGFSVDVYEMVRVQKHLGLAREGLIALALLCGCDYQTDSQDARGVAGIGIETASNLVVCLSKRTENILDRLEAWKSDAQFMKLEIEAAEIGSGPSCMYCGHRGNLGSHDRVGCRNCGTKKGCYKRCSFSEENSLLNMPLDERRSLMIELGVRQKAIVNPNFPSLSIIDEYSSPVNSHISSKDTFDTNWYQPSLDKFLEFAKTYLEWSEEYALGKFLPLLTRWKIMNGKQKISPYDVHPISINKGRMSKGVLYYEVKWKLIPGLMKMSQFTTLEPRIKFEELYPDLVQEFQMKRTKNLNRDCNGRERKSRRTVTKNNCKCSDGNLENKGHLCNFITSTKEVKSEEEKNKISDLKSDINQLTNLLDNLDIEEYDVIFSSSENDSIPEFDDEIDALELSSIVKGIVSRSSDITNDIDQHNFTKNQEVDISPSRENHYYASDDEFGDSEFAIHTRTNYNLERSADSSTSADEEIRTAASGSKADSVKRSHYPCLSPGSPQYINTERHSHNLNFSLGTHVLLRSPDQQDKKDIL